MKAVLTIGQKEYQIDFSKPLDISISLRDSLDNPIAWYLDKPEIQPVRIDGWVGKVSEGQSSTNFNTIVFNPHAHGTHTECLGHITHDFYSINQQLTTFVFLSQVITIIPERREDDFVITKELIQSEFIKNGQSALVIRTFPNSDDKLSKNYSHTNPPYLDVEATLYIKKQGVKHLLIDLPSVDKEKDEGKLVSHKAFWGINDVVKIGEETRMDCTITEMVYVENKIKDGFYILNLQIAPFENDASPSKPVLYNIENI